MNIKGHNFQRMMTGMGMVVSFYTDDAETVENFFQESLPDELDVTIGKVKKKRSVNANAFAWVLMDKIAAKLKTSSIEVYKEIIKRVGVFDFQLVLKEAVNDFIARWALQGVGYFAENYGDRWVEVEKPNGEKSKQLMTTVKLYFGTSTYTTEEMSRLIDEIVSEAKKLGIETMTPDAIEELKQKWG